MPEIKITTNTLGELEAFVAGFELARNLDDTVTIWDENRREYFVTLLASFLPESVTHSAAELYREEGLYAS